MRKKKIKNQPPMRKWVVTLLIVYFLCMMRIYATPKDFTIIEFIRYIIILFQQVILKVIYSDLKFAFFSFAILGIILIICIIDKEFRYMFFGRLIEIKKEVTGEIDNEEWADAKKLVRKQIYVCHELNEYTEMIYDLCEMACVYEVNFIVDDSQNSIISSFEKNGQAPMIGIKTELINRLEIIEPSNVRNRILKFIIAHELIHVKYHDSINKIWIWRFYGLLWIGGFALLWNYFVASVSLGIIHKTISMMLFLVWCLFASILISRSFWWQVIEFRADRLGIKISGESVQIFEIYAKYFPDGFFGKKDLSKRLQNYRKVIISFFFSKTTQNDEIGHPSNRRRIEELKRGKDWNLFEYFRYGYKMKKNSLMGNGKKL
ncbi:MAG: M48 family metalloprotease [Ruminococcus flavefaciens]|nr:M48 family metalloprotease [Ruminococcus flavefaciens]